jgi:hypothetical protein
MPKWFSGTPSALAWGLAVVLPQALNLDADTARLLTVALGVAGVLWLVGVALYRRRHRADPESAPPPDDAGWLVDAADEAQVKFDDVEAVADRGAKLRDKSKFTAKKSRFKIGKDRVDDREALDGDLGSTSTPLLEPPAADIDAAPTAGKDRRLGGDVGPVDDDGPMAVDTDPEFPRRDV